MIKLCRLVWDIYFEFYCGVWAALTRLDADGPQARQEIKAAAKRIKGERK